MNRGNVTKRCLDKYFRKKAANPERARCYLPRQISCDVAFFLHHQTSHCSDDDWEHPTMAPTALHQSSGNAEESEGNLIVERNDTNALSFMRCVNHGHCPRPWLIIIPSSDDDGFGFDRDILNENRERSRDLAEEEIAIWLEHCKEHPDDWEFFASTLKDTRSARVRLGTWQGIPKALGSRNVRPLQANWDEHHSTTEEETSVELGADSCDVTPSNTLYKLDPEKLRSKADWLRRIVGGSSIQKKPKGSKGPNKSVKARSRQKAHGLDTNFEKIG